ncbi:MAG: hypothetical protein EOP83_36405, partial [Verrucomicrobiaceae bacterium]
MVIDDRAGSSDIGTTPVSIKGGSIKVEGYSADLASGGMIDVSGGASINAKGSVSYGNAGNFTIATGREIGFSATLGGHLNLGSTLKGYSGGTGGTLSLTGSAIQVGGNSTAPSVTRIGEEFFNQGGFSNISLTGIGIVGSDAPAMNIVAGTVIKPVVQSWLAQTTPGNFHLETITREEGLRTPASLSFGALGASFNNLPLVIGNLEMGQGAVIETDAKGSVSFSGQAITLRGAVTTAGGTISIAGRNQYPSNTTVPTEALPTVHLASSAALSTAGKTVLTQNPFGLRQGQVLAGGSISVSGNIIAETGAVLDVSGTRGILDLPPQSASLDRATVDSSGNRNTVP